MSGRDPKPADDLDVEVVFTYEVEQTDAVDEAQLRRAVETALRGEGIAGQVELSVVMTDDAAIRELNARFRGQDVVTDVLSFPQEAKGVDAVFPGQTNGPRLLGDVVVALPQANRQADEYGHSLSRELAYLVVHGTLHLLGYDHETEAERGVMRAREEAALTELPRDSS